MDKNEAQKLLTRRLFTEGERKVADDIYSKGRELTDLICDHTIRSPERTLAVRRISEALMYVSVGISLNPLEPKASNAA